MSKRGDNVLSVTGFNFDGTVHKYDYEALDNKIEKTALAPGFVVEKTYSSGDMVLRDGKLYSRRIDGTDEEWVSGNWILSDVSEKIANLKDDLNAIEPGLSDDAKAALLACFEHVAWSGNNGQDYYDALETALYAQKSGLSAKFTQGNDKYYPFDDLNSLKEHLVVTYTNEQGQSDTITNYTLSGILVIGTSRISVNYNGLTATLFTVVVSDLTIINKYTYGTVRPALDGKWYFFVSDQATARARTDLFKNQNYTFNILNTTKYSISGNNNSDGILREFEMEDGTQKQGYLMTENVTPSWASSFTATSNYAVLAFKKNDGTDFTQSEIENAYGTIYTVS